MTIESLDVPWAASPPLPKALPRTSGVDVLPGYASAKTRESLAALAVPWSDQAPGIPRVPPIDSLDRMALAD